MEKKKECCIHYNMLFYHNVLYQYIFLSMTATPQRQRFVRHNIHGPWIIDGIDFYSSFILNYMNITIFFTIDSIRFLESLPSRTSSDVSILLVSAFSLNSSQLANLVVEDEQTKKWSLCHLRPTLSTGMNVLSIILPPYVFLHPWR